MGIIASWLTRNDNDFNQGNTKQTYRYGYKYQMYIHMQIYGAYHLI